MCKFFLKGRCNTTGNIKVTTNTLELIRLGVPTMVWPLRSLRQYGHDADIFTFESGRRGPQGPGVYSFRCSRAKQLFELVQKNVHRNTQDDTNNGLRRISVGNIIDTPSNTIPVQAPPIPPPPLLDSVPNSPLAILSPSAEYTNAQYMNVTVPSVTTPANQDNYERLTQQDTNDPKVSYATLELNPVNTITESEANNNGAQGGNGPYAMINLDMTQALSALNAAGLGSPNDEGIRRTRHNSTLEGISNFSLNGKLLG